MGHETVRGASRRKYSQRVLASQEGLPPKTRGDLPARSVRYGGMELQLTRQSETRPPVAVI